MIQTIRDTAPGRVENIDKTAPEITSIEAVPSQDEASITVTLNVKETQSGIKTVNWEFKEADQEWRSEEQTIETSNANGMTTGETSGTITKTFGTLKEGTSYTFKAKVTDVANNQSSVITEGPVQTTTLGIKPTTDNIGDYVDYPIDINNDGKHTNDWRVFYVGQPEDGEANGRIFLIAADYVSHKCDALSAATSKSKMSKHENVNGLNSDAYGWNTFPGYVCYDGRNGVNASKPQCSFPYLFMPVNQYCDINHMFYCSDHDWVNGSNAKNTCCAAALQCTSNWSSFATSIYADYAIGGPTINMWIESWNSRHGQDFPIFANGSSIYGYGVGGSSVSSATASDVVITDYKDGYDDDLFFSHKGSFNDLDNDSKKDHCARILVVVAG